MMSDLVELWERAAVDGTSVRDIVGEDPWTSPRPSPRPTPGCGGSTRSGHVWPRPSTTPNAVNSHEHRGGGRIDPGHPRSGPAKVVPEARRPARGRLRGRAGHDLRPLGLERCWQDHGDPHPLDAARRRWRVSGGGGIRRRHRGASCPGSHQPHGQFAAVDEVLSGRENLLLSPGSVMSAARSTSRTISWPASPSPRRARGRSRPTRAGCDAVSTSP